MARIITLEELIHTEEATGWIEEFFAADDEFPDLIFVSAAAYNNKKLADLDGVKYFDYTKYNVKRNGGFRIWDSKPTEEEQKNAAWGVV